MTTHSEDAIISRKRPWLPTVFMDPPDKLDETWTHGFLLIGHGDWQPLSDGDLASDDDELVMRLHGDRALLGLDRDPGVLGDRHGADTGTIRRLARTISFHLVTTERA